MHARATLPAPLLAVATGRGGVVTRAEMLSSGLGRGAAEALMSACCRILPGVYALGVRADADPALLGHIVRAWAGVLYAGRDSLVAGWSALHLEGVVDAAPAVVEIAIPHARRVRAQRGYRFVRRRPHVLGDPWPRDLPRLRIEDALLDVCATASPDEALGLVASACQRGRTRADRVLHRLEQRAAHPLRRLLREVLEDVALGATSHLELGYVSEVERPHGLPPPTRQFVVPESGHRVDGAYEQERLLVEQDGAAFHTGPARAADLALDAQHLAAGWATIRVTHAMVFGTPCQTAARVESVRVARGGRPAMRRCPRCPPAAL